MTLKVKCDSQEFWFYLLISYYGLGTREGAYICFYIYSSQLSNGYYYHYFTGEEIRAWGFWLAHSGWHTKKVLDQYCTQICLWFLVFSTFELHLRVVVMRRHLLTCITLVSHWCQCWILPHTTDSFLSFDSAVSPTLPKTSPLFRVC